MQTVSLCLRIHQPFRLGPFPFFEIGKGKAYFDDHLNHSILQKESQDYLAINGLLLKLVKKHGEKFSINLCISGTALEQAQLYCPKLIRSFQELSETGGVEFIGTTYSNSLAGSGSKREFSWQALDHAQLIQNLFLDSPKVFQFSKLSFTNVLGEILDDLGFEKVILDGTAPKKNMATSGPISGNASPPKKVLLYINQALGDEILREVEANPSKVNGAASIRWADRLLELPENGTPVLIGLNYQQLGELIRMGTDILGFLEKVVTESVDQNLEFVKISAGASPEIPSEWEDSPNSLSPVNEVREELLDYLGNEMQREAFYTLYELEDSVIAFADAEMRKDWVKLQSADHFYYMSTGQSDSDQIPPRFSPYHSPYQAFINYMNVLSDLKIRLENEAAAQKKRKEKEALPYPIRSEAETRGEAAIQEETIFR